MILRENVRRFESKAIWMYGYIDYTIFDLETTGLDPSLGHKIVEIGAVRIRRSGDERVFQTLVNPERPIPAGATSIHHITDEMVKTSPTIREVLPSFLNFCRDSVMVAHNARFDLKFLSFAMSESSIPPLRNVVLDSVKLSRRFFPDLDSYSLPALRRVFDLECEEEHRALSDVRATLWIFRKCLRRAMEEGIDTIEKLQEAQGGPITFPLPQPSVEPILSNKLVRLLLRAMDRGSEVRILYRETEGGRVEKRITPRRFLKYGYHVYMVAYCHMREAERTFRLDRIELPVESGGPD